ncbi:hypothetical protein LINPERHAP1_LOCUS33447 [Linum perenne]
MGAAYGLLESDCSGQVHSQPADTDLASLRDFCFYGSVLQLQITAPAFSGIAFCPCLDRLEQLCPNQNPRLSLVVFSQPNLDDRQPQKKRIPDAEQMFSLLLRGGISQPHFHPLPFLYSSLAIAKFKTFLFGSFRGGSYRLHLKLERYELCDPLSVGEQGDFTLFLLVYLVGKKQSHFPRLPRIGSSVDFSHLAGKRSLAEGLFFLVAPRFRAMDAPTQLYLIRSLGTRFLGSWGL